MNNNILLQKPYVKFEKHASMSPEFPFVIHPNITRPRGIFSLHESLEILHFMDGDGFVVYDGVRYPVHKGDFVVVNSYCLHQVVSDGELLHFCLIIGKNFCLYNSFDPSRLIFEHIIRDDPQMTALFRRVMDSYADQTGDFYHAALKCAVLDLLLHLCRCHSTPRPDDQPAKITSLEYIRRATGYIKANLSQKLSADEIAAYAGLSKYHFLREFKRITGHTLNHYLNAIRCEYARNMLESGRCSIKEAAYACGFTNASYFAKVFHQYMGMLPSQVCPPEE
ncbi:MAG: helix-turn-helix domain-containing protein [Oscillospiraceae bacterium]|nr:helix-turn-helix domain-containing protein [Oscillospiraceae bacterium]